MTIEINKFGKDHWSTLAYVETCNVDNKGVMDRRRMRCNPDKHPLLAHTPQWSSSYSTILRDGVLEDGHDDWDCINDLEAAGLVEPISLVNAIVLLTEKGKLVSAQLRVHKMGGGKFGNFQYQEPDHVRT